jgi:hypothetical protein
MTVPAAQDNLSHHSLTAVELKYGEEKTERNSKTSLSPFSASRHRYAQTGKGSEPIFHLRLFSNFRHPEIQFEQRLSTK